MMLAYRILTKKYARAYLNIFGTQCTDEVINRCVMLHDFLKKQHAALFYVQLSSAPLVVKVDVLTGMAERYQLGLFLKPLLQLLETHKRLFLLADILAMLRTVYEEQHNTMRCAITSTRALKESEREKIVHFLTEKTKMKIHAQYSIDPSIIAGIRVLSDTIRWEHSIHAFLKLMKKKSAAEGYSWR